MTNNYRQKQFRPHVTENIGLIEQQKPVIRDRATSAHNEPPKRLTLPKHYCNETYSPLVPSKKKERQKRGSVSKGTIVSNKNKKNTIPWGERKEEKIRNWSSDHPYLSRHHLLHTGHQAPPVGSKKEQPPSSRCPVDPQQMSHSVTGIRQNPPLSEENRSISVHPRAVV